MSIHTTLCIKHTNTHTHIDSTTSIFMNHSDWCIWIDKSDTITEIVTQSNGVAQSQKMSKLATHSIHALYLTYFSLSLSFHLFHFFSSSSKLQLIMVFGVVCKIMLPAEKIAFSNRRQSMICRGYFYILLTFSNKINK